MLPVWKVPVERAAPDPGVVGDELQWDGEAVLTEDHFTPSEEQFAVSPDILSLDHAVECNSYKTDMGVHFMVDLSYYIRRDTMAQGLKDVVVITGLGGMGLAIARRLGSGRHLVLADYAQDLLDRVAETLRSEGHHLDTVRVDVADAQSVANLAQHAAGLGTLRAVIHTAGVSPVQASPERVVQVDVLGTAHVLDAFLPFVSPGTVAVCIASMAGTMVPLPPEIEHALAVTPTDALAQLPLLDPTTLDPGAAYSIAKRANQLRVQAASLPWGRQGGRVVSVSPGVISTPMGQAELQSAHGDTMRHMVQASGTGRLGTPDDIASAVEFLISPQASFITGTDLLVDGGVVAGLRYGGQGEKA